MFQLTVSIYGLSLFHQHSDQSMIKINVFYTKNQARLCKTFNILYEQISLYSLVLLIISQEYRSFSIVFASVINEATVPRIRIALADKLGEV